MPRCTPPTDPAGRLPQTTPADPQPPAAAAHVPSKPVASAGKAVSMPPILWLDLEMTGLNLESDVIMEVAYLVTDGAMNALSEGVDLILHVAAAKLDGMGKWCKDHHGASGLTQACRDATLTCADAEVQILADLVKYFARPRQAQLAGNSIHTDRAFIRRYMPKLFAYLHYRIIDVSSFLTMGYYWAPKVMESMDIPEADHRALSDILRSIRSLQWFRTNLIKGT